MPKSNYWRTRSTGDSHAPELYTELSSDRLDNFFSDIIRILSFDARILEIGPMAGRNLEYLRLKGYKNFYGIEININAKKLFKQTFPESYKLTEFIQGDANVELKKIHDRTFDLVFTVGCLQNIENDKHILSEIPRISSNYILIKEPASLKESAFESGLFFHDYEKEFYRFGFSLIMKKVLPDNKFGTTPTSNSDKVPTLQLFARNKLDYL
ncbi:MAG: class I SAM-dependent methyltransferase [bacterium]